MIDKSPAPAEQLRRLKNTVMGVAQRLSQLAGAPEFSRAASEELASVSRELAQTAQRLERLLAALRDRG